MRGYRAYQPMQVVTWGDCMMGADSSIVQEKLQNIHSVEGSRGAFAALSKYGAVVTWGPAAYGGDCKRVEAELHDIQLLRASVRAFAALRKDGRVILGHNYSASPVTCPELCY